MSPMTRNILVTVLVVSTFGGIAGAQDDFNVCQKTDLLRALAYVYYGCGQICDKAVIKQLDSAIIDRPTLLGILSSPRVTARHIFFEPKVTNVDDALDWDLRGGPGSKREQLQSLRQAVDRGGMLFLLGKASTLDTTELNERLSKERMESVRDYLKEIGVDCPHTKGGWFGEDAFQFDESDAARLGIRPHEYRSPSPAEFDQLGPEGFRRKHEKALWTLNQAVHIVFVPCSPQSLFVEHRLLVWHHHKESLRASSVAERRRHERIRNTLFRNDEDSAKFDSELCAYCTGTGPRPAGTPSSITARDACELARSVRLSGQECRKAR